MGIFAWTHYTYLPIKKNLAPSLQITCYPWPYLPFPLLNPSLPSLFQPPFLPTLQKNATKIVVSPGEEYDARLPRPILPTRPVLSQVGHTPCIPEPCDPVLVMYKSVLEGQSALHIHIVMNISFMDILLAQYLILRYLKHCSLRACQSRSFLTPKHIRVQNSWVIGMGEKLGERPSNLLYKQIGPYSSPEVLVCMLLQYGVNSSHLFMA